MTSLPPSIEQRLKEFSVSDKEIVKRAKEGKNYGRGYMYIGIADVREILQEALEEKDKEQGEVIMAAADLYQNRLGWSDGRNPYAPPEFWRKLGEALGAEEKKECPACDGEGERIVWNEGEKESVSCGRCDGRGTIMDCCPTGVKKFPCPDCKEEPVPEGECERCNDLMNLDDEGALKCKDHEGENWREEVFDLVQTVAKKFDGEDGVVFDMMEGGIIKIAEKALQSQALRHEKEMSIKEVEIVSAYNRGHDDALSGLKVITTN